MSPSVPWVRGSRTEFGMVMAQPDGSPAAYVDVELRISAGDRCAVVRATPRDLEDVPGGPATAGWVLPLNDETLGDLPARAYRATVWRRDGAGAWAPVLDPQSYTLIVKEAC